IASDQPIVENIISRVYEILINKMDKRSLLAKLLEPLNDNEYFFRLLETTTPDPYAMQTELRKFEDLYKDCFKEFSITYFKSFIHNRQYLRENSNYQERQLACALILLNRSTNFLDDFLDIIFNATNNMSLKASCLINYVGRNDKKENVKKFYLQYGKNKALLNKWFATQIQYSTPKLALDRLRELTTHSDFNMYNPNNFNSVVGTFAKRNFHAFHQKDGYGYKEIANWIKKIDPENPQIAASTTKAFEQIKFLPNIYKAKAKATLKDLSNGNNLSKDTSEILNKIEASL
ncbi:MAG: aminopeptidase N C-terminal domain-containing protein, partial [Pseudomonadota bacterium]|nr:aminopeptidase N C-terminal domain-containing protein [Pseudomonadota bacterium]